MRAQYVSGLFACALAILPMASQAAISKQAAIEPTKSALKLPLANRMQKIEAQGAQGYRNLVAIMFDDSQTMETRWRAVISAAKIGGKESMPELERAISRPEWFMRNAALIAMTGVDREKAVKSARRLMSDKALVVRVAAVEVLTELRDKASAPLLWEKLYAKENFKRQQSLFIRRRIVESLALLEPAGNEGKFIEVLSDKDASLHAVAVFGLEQLTKKKLGPEDGLVSLHRKAWIAWWSEHRNEQSL